MTQKEDWVDIGAVEDIPVRGARRVETPHGPVALFRTADGGVFAIDDRCPHLGGSLSQGIVHGHCVTCPLHNLVIDLETGTAQQPEGGGVETYAVETRGGRVLLNLKSRLQNGAA